MDGLISPDLPPELYYLWSLYLDIKKGTDIVTWKDLDHYNNVTGITISPWEASLMIDIDMARRTHG